MPATNVFIDKKAQKQLDNLPKNIQSKVCDVIDVLQQEGFSKKLDVKKVKSLTNSFRVRVGTYRVLFLFSSGNTIEIYAILPRKNAYNKT
ncbi:MAG: type II toxin-antitoxin system RelE/ParE family toxin [Nitrososphaerota archaeon]|nr:type II toxin-antitoxin system RelE/ParE family toxin [Nitrososphaerota archaeon]